MGFFIEDEEYHSAPYPISFVTELLGTAIMMFFGCGGCYNIFGLGPLLPAFSFGFAILLSLQAIGHISPCHINPGVSLGFLIVGEMYWFRFLIYVVAQYLGALFGYLLLWYSMAFPTSHSGFCLLRVKLGTVAQAFALEFIGGVTLMIAVLGVTDPKCKKYFDSKYLRIALMVVGIVLAIETHTGCGINSARALPPALLLNDWENNWLYHVAPTCGTAFGAVFYRFVLSESEPYSLNSWLDHRRMVHRSRMGPPS